MNKDLIEKRFEKNLANYEKNAFVQKNMAEKLFSFLDKKRYDNILELGCGTGILTKIIAENLNFAHYTANDIVSGCEKYIKKINKNIEFVHSDMEDFIHEDEKKYDLIVSNAALQWVENVSVFVENLYDKLNDGGVILFSTFGKDNYKEIQQITGKALKYFSKIESEKMLSQYEPNIEEYTEIIAFNSPQEVLKHMRYTGVNALEETFWTKKDVADFETKYNELFHDKCPLTYNPIYIKIVKTVNTVRE